MTDAAAPASTEGATTDPQPLWGVGGFQSEFASLSGESMGGAMGTGGDGSNTSTSVTPQGMGGAQVTPQQNQQMQSSSTSSSIAAFFVQGAVVLLGIVFVLGGIYMLKPNAAQIIAPKAGV